jgi:thiol-disulfide isomerase/thioredoxin
MILFLGQGIVPAGASEKKTEQSDPPSQKRGETEEVCDPATGPCLLDASKTPRTSGGPQVMPAMADATQKPRAIESPAPEDYDQRLRSQVDLEKKPWLVESAGLPPEHPAFRRPRMIWADSFQWVEAPEIEVEEWITEKPRLDGKYILVECWATWCPPCRRSLPLLNYYHEKYKDELAVISICETDREALEIMEEPLELEDIDFHLAVDTQRRFADALGVFGIPHAVIIEPQHGVVIWEGMPTLPGYELSEDIIERILAIGRRLKKQQANEKQDKENNAESASKDP